MPSHLTFLRSQVLIAAAAAIGVLWSGQVGAQPAATVLSAVAVAPDISAGVDAYANRRYQAAADALKPHEQTHGRAAGIVCEMFVQRLLSPDDARGAAACETAVRLADPHGLVWRAMAGRERRASLGLAVTEAASLGYLAQAAELGYLPAYGRLCEYHYGKKQLAQAVPLCKLAAGRGSPEGLYFFALMALEGQGVVQDFSKGRNALLLSARLNSAQALIKLAQLSRDGASGFRQDKSKAYSWVLLALAQAPDAPQVLALQQALAAELGPDKMATAQQRATDWQNAKP